MDIEPDFKHIAIVILAAGGSSRLGRPKQLLKDLDDQSLIRRICTLALTIPVRKTYVVLGHLHQSVSEDIQDLNISILINEDWNSGIGSSIKLGVEVAERDDHELEALIFLLCDQPFVSKELITSMILKYFQTHKPIVASHYQNVIGNPALFNLSFFPQLMQLKGDRGAGKLINENLEKVGLVEFEDGIFDIDTMLDYDLYIQ